jgi:translation initiation factor IF-1
MKRVYLCALASLLVAWVPVALSQQNQQNQPKQGAQPSEQANQLEGQVVRVVGNDQVVIRTSDGKEITVHMSPDTKYRLTEKGGQFNDLKPGTDIGVQYDTRDKRQMATNVVAVTRVEGEIVRVVGKDRVVLRTADGKEVEVNVAPQTRYQIVTKGDTYIPGGVLTDLRPGLRVGVYYDLNERRPIARRIFGLRR